MSKKLITDQELATVISSVVDAATSGDMKAASLIFAHFVPKPKPKTACTGIYKTIDDLRDAYYLGILTPEDVIAHAEALGLLGSKETKIDISSWNPEMIKYINQK